MYVRAFVCTCMRVCVCVRGIIDVLIPMPIQTLHNIILSPSEINLTDEKVTYDQNNNGRVN